MMDCGVASDCTASVTFDRTTVLKMVSGLLLVREVVLSDRIEPVLRFSADVSDRGESGKVASSRPFHELSSPAELRISTLPRKCRSALPMTSRANR